MILCQILVDAEREKCRRVHADAEALKVHAAAERAKEPVHADAEIMLKALTNMRLNSNTNTLTSTQISLQLHLCLHLQ